MFNKSNIPVVKGHWLFGSALEFSKDPVAFIMNKTPEYGDFFQVRMGFRKFYLTSNPEFFKHVLQTNNKNYIKDVLYQKLSIALGEGLLLNEGESWRKQRRLTQPLFYKKRLESLFETMVDISLDFAESLEKHKNTGQAINITREMNAVTSEIVVQTLLGGEMPRNSKEIQDIIFEAQQYIVMQIRRPVKSFFSYLNGGYNRFKNHIQHFDKIIFDIIDDRKKNPQDHNDLLSMLMAARDEDTGEPMTNRQLRDEVITIYVAGHETSSNALSWIWYLLAKNPEVREKVKIEIEEKLGDARPDFASIMQLSYLNQVVQESMRLFPPAWAIGREAVEADDINGLQIRPKDMFLFSVYALHRNPDLWEDPEKFDPERFSPKNCKDRPKFNYIPFGAGPRMCIGNNFAIMEIMLLVAVLVRKFEFELLEGHPVIAEPLITLKPKFGIQVFVS